MPKKILASQRAKFTRLRAAGFSIKEASQKAGFSESYGKGLVRNGVGDNATSATIATAEETELSARPRRIDDLSPVARDCLDDFERFRYRYLGSVSTPWQIEAAHEIDTRLDAEDSQYGVVNSPQGGGKTRLFSHDIPAWLTAKSRTRGDNLRGILGSHGMNVSQALTGNLRDTLERTVPVLASPRWKALGMEVDAEATMSADYGRFKPSMAGVTWKKDQFFVERLWLGNEVESQYSGSSQQKEPTWAAFSYEAKFLGWRVDFMNWDDVHTEGMLNDQAQMNKLYRWWDIEAESRLDPGGLCLVTMQRLGANDLSRYLLDKIDPDFEIDADKPTAKEDSPRQYFHVVFKAHYDDRCQGDHGKTATPYPEGCMLDPGRVTERLIRTKKTAGVYEIVYQQEDVVPGAQLVRKPWIDGGTDPLDGVDYPGCWDVDRGLGELPPNLNLAVRYITADPSPTKWWAVMDWLYVPALGVTGEPETELTGNRYLIDIARVKMQASELLDWSNDQQSWVGLLEEWVLRAKSQSVPISTLIFERNAAQRWVMQYEHFHRWRSRRGVDVLPHETTTNKSDADLGIEATIPSVYRYGRVRLPGKGIQTRSSVYPLVQEVTTWPNATTDDCVMSQWFGEYHLPSLAALRYKGGTMFTDMPSWMRKKAP